MKYIITWGQYTRFHEGTNREIIQDAEKFFKTPKPMYGKDIMDVIVCAAANTLETNFAIYQNTVPRLQQTGQST